MNSYSKAINEANLIYARIQDIMVKDCQSFGYNMDNWEITIEYIPTKLDVTLYARVYAFNTLSSTANKHILIRLGKLTIEDFEDEINPPNISGYIVLKYPYR